MKISSRRLVILVIVGVLMTGSIGVALNGYFGGGAGSEALAADSLTRGLVGYWNFDEGAGQTANDSSDSNNDGTLTNMQNEDWVQGKIGTALDFDGVDDYVEVVSSAGDELDITGALSIGFWMRNDAAANGLSLIGKIPSAGVNHYACRTFASAAAISCQTRDGSLNDVVTVSNTNDGNWHYILFTHDGNGNLEIFFDGVSEATETGVGDSVSSSDNVFIGAQSGGANGFNGAIDEVRVYNRALSAAEIKMLYNRGGPVGHWKFDEGSGTTAYDSSGNENNGTLTNMATSTVWVSGKYGTALDFDATDDLVNAGSDSSLDNLAVITISAWIKPTSFNPFPRIITKGFSNGFVMFLAGGGGFGNNSVFFRLNTSGGGSVNAEAIAADNSIVLNQWQHVVATADSSLVPRLYINGTEVAYATQTTGIGARDDDSAIDVIIGNVVAEDRPFQGLIDDVRVYGYARTAGEIRLDYNAGFAARFGGSPAKDINRGLVGYWNFDEGTGQTAADATDNSNDGTLTSGTAWVFGKVGAAVQFNGSGTDNVSKTSPSGVDGLGTLSIAGLGTLSIAIWSLLPSKSRAVPYLPLTQVGAPEAVPVLPCPLESNALVPDPSSNFQWPIGLPLLYR